MELVEAQQQQGGAGGKQLQQLVASRHIPYRDSRLTFLLQVRWWMQGAAFPAYRVAPSVNSFGASRNILPCLFYSPLLPLST